ncbi:MAG TPA: EAL domain-containing protein [Methylobacter sp.]
MTQIPDFRILFESVPDFYLVLSPAFEIVAVNDAYAKATLTLREDILGKVIFDVFPDNPGDPSAEGVHNLRASLQRVLQTLKPDSMPVQKYDIPRPEQLGGGFEERYWSPLNCPIVGADGKLLYIIHRVEDVTEFVRIKQQGVEQGKLNDSLREQAIKMEMELFKRAQEVAATSAELKTANEELTRLYAKSLELDTLKTNFFAKVSHELRTPLTLILNPIAKYLSESDLDPAKRQELEMIERNARLLYRHVCDLLDVAKVEAQQMSLYLQAVDLAYWVRLTASNFESSAHHRGITLTVITPDALYTQVDVEKIQRILLNLLSNAIKFTPDGGAIRVELLTEDEQAVILVQDNGPGIPESMRTVIFEPFRQLDDSATRRFCGTGLGLAIVADFVKLHHGQVTATDASADGGALFKICLPLITADKTPAIADACSASKLDPLLQRQTLDELHAAIAIPNEAFVSHDTQLILIVEDNADMAAYLANLLNAKYRVAVANNGRQGLETALALRPDLIIADVMMPDMSGDQMVESLRVKPELIDLPIIMLTAKDDDELRLKLLKVGVQNYFVKPFNANDLMARITSLLKERQRFDQKYWESETRFQATFEQAPVGIAMMTPDGHWLRVNRQLCTMLGYSYDELLKKTVQEITYPENLATDSDFVGQMLTGTTQNCVLETRYICKQGTIIWINLSVSLIKKPSGTPDYFILVIENITDRKRIERQLQLAATVYRGSAESIMVCDANKSIVAVNPAFTLLTGYSEQEAIGNKPSLLKSGRHGLKFYQHMWQILDKTGHWQGEIWSRRKNGEVYPEWLTISTVYDDQGKIQQYVGMFSDITEQKQAEQTIWQQANFDPLTGLPNRNMFHEQLRQEIKHADRNRTQLALLFLDLDFFKEVNDTLGHDNGDLLLKETALRLKECVREVDTISRLGGDEFTIILSNLENNTAIVEQIAQRILERLAEPFILGAEVVHISTSVGISNYPNDTRNEVELIKNADQAMYVAKREGRNRHHYFTFELQQAATTRLHLINDLHKAVEEQQFILYYQPIVDLKDGRIYKAEALIRWQHPERGLVSPTEFIPLTEETGLINRIGDWTFRTVIRQLDDWRQTLHPDFQISINKSPVQFRNESNDCNTLWVDELRHAGLPGQSIVIEITEGLLMDSTQSIAKKLLAFRDAGIQVSIDDFGTGYSSLSYLKKFDIDYLKIDQSFTRGLTDNSNDFVLCEAIITMAHKLGLKVIAEGVETKEQCQLLIKMGCDYGQGYWFSKPLPAFEFQSLLENKKIGFS